jgi:hypothetical protein
MSTRSGAGRRFADYHVIAHREWPFERPGSSGFYTDHHTRPDHFEGRTAPGRPWGDMAAAEGGHGDVHVLRGESLER